MRSPRRSLHTSPLIEPLESRIAPAALNLIAYDYTDHSANKTGTQSLAFVNAASPGTDPANIAIATTVGMNPNVYFIKVSAGETLQVYTTQTGPETLVNVSKGTVVAFFTDSNPSDTIVDPTTHLVEPAVVASDLTGLSVGNKVSAVIKGGVNGDVVTNYNDATGQLGGTVATPGHPGTTETSGTAHNLLPNVVSSLTVSGAITGDFIAGGAVTFLQVTGAVNEILTGTAANGHIFSFESVANTTGTTNLIVNTPGSGVAAPSMTTVEIDSANLIQLGNGGPGAAGGSLGALTLLNDSTAITIQGGMGGAGISGKAAGGAGGAISNVVVNGLDSPVGNVNSLISVLGGAGGAGLGAAGGGAGGAITNVYVDYTHTSAAVYTPATNFLSDDVLVQGGAGGSGGLAGVGGSLKNINILASTPSTAHSAMTPGTPEFQLLGGVGGSTTVGGRGGAGGSVTGVNINNNDLPVVDVASPSLPDDTASSSPTNTLTLIQGGAGGSAAIRGPGGAGGSVSTLTLEGFNFTVLSGAGGQGVSAGGAGGKVATVNVLGSSGSLPGDNFHAQSVVVITGAGGAGTAGPGGAGGSVTGLTVTNANFGANGYEGPAAATFGNYGFEVVTGAGGAAGKGAAGAGGSITGVQVTEVDFSTASHPLGTVGTVNIAAGNGGSSPVAGGSGGKGGSVSTVTFVGTRIASSGVTAGLGGTGGAAGLAGRGGAGGSITGVAIRNSETLFPSNTTASAGLLIDTTANFVTDGIKVGDPVENTTTGVTTTVTSVAATQLGLASDIFAAGDPYTLTNEGDSGTAQDSQDTIIDASTNFIADHVQAGDIVTDLTTSATVTVNGVTANTLSVSADISHVGDEYTITLPNGVALATTLSGANFTAGNGGNGFLTGAGGAGGAISDSNAVVPGPVAFLGGTGGNGGATAAAGIGGSLVKDGAVTTNGSGSMTAGNAGATGSKAGAGGSISGANISAPLNVTLIAGNGFDGGAGGSITSSGYTGAPDDTGGLQLAPPSGNITLQAGAGGSSSVGAGGAGGSIAAITGFISSGDGLSTDTFTTQFDAGAGGNGISKAGAGGSVSNLNFFGGGGPGVIFYVNAGDAGNATTAKTGAAGGSITNIGGGADLSTAGDPDFSINPLTNFHHLSAGNGGNALLKGGVGGSVSNVFVNATIGVRTGAAFGFDLAGAGGISAGAGGTGTTAGLAGNVSDITADAIASIVAGHISSGQGLQATNLANDVKGIILNGTVSPSLVHQFDLSFGGDQTVSLPSNATPIQVASALNALPTVIAAGGVTVSAGPSGGYVVTFNDNGAQSTITGEEPGVSPDGNSALTVDGIAPVPPNPLANPPTFGTPGTNEVQTVHVAYNNNNFFLGFDGQNTTLLPANATAAQVQSALNALPGLASVGGVSVTETVNPTTTDYTVTFNVAAADILTPSTTTPAIISAPVHPVFSSEAVQGNSTTSTSEVQNVQVLAPDAFTLSFNGQTTTVLAAGATAMQVQTALDNLSNISAQGGVNVVMSVNPVTHNPNYNITFSNAAGAQSLIIPNFSFTDTPSGGTAMAPSVQALAFPARGDIDPLTFSTANFVGSIANIIQPAATTFAYTGTTPFHFGDVPIDGLIAAVNLEASKNFIPEAYVTEISGAAALIDNTNS